MPKKKLKGNYNQSVSRFDAKSNEAVSVNSYSYMFSFCALFFSFRTSFSFLFTSYALLNIRNMHIIHAGTKQDNKTCDWSLRILYIFEIKYSMMGWSIFFLIFPNVWIRLVKGCIKNVSISRVTLNKRIVIEYFYKSKSLYGILSVNVITNLDYNRHVVEIHIHLHT